MYLRSSWRRLSKDIDLFSVCISITIFVLLVYSLRERCLQIVRGMFTNDSIKELCIPKTLIDDLLARPNVDYVDCTL